MNLEDKKIAILSITNNGRELALKIKEIMKNVDVFFIKKDTDYKKDEVIVVNKALKEFIPQIFDKYDYLINWDGIRTLSRRYKHSENSIKKILIESEKTNGKAIY